MSNSLLRRNNNSPDAYALARRSAIILAIFLLTIAVRGALLSRVSEADLLHSIQSAHGYRSGDEGINIAVALIKKGEFGDPFLDETGPTAHVPPVYPLATSVVFRCFGFGHTAALIRNGIMIAGLGLLFASLPLASAALGIGFSEGAVAGFFAAAYPICRSSEIYRGRDEWLGALLLLWLTILAYRIGERREFLWRDAGLLAVGWEILLHTQPSALPVLLVQVAFCAILLRNSMTRKASLRRAYAAAALLVVLLTPWTLRNRRVLGSWMFMRDNLGLELRLANADGVKASFPENIASGEFCKVAPICSEASTQKIRQIGEVAFNQELGLEAKAWIVHHPAQFSRLTLERVAEFWADVPYERITRTVRLFWSAFAWAGLILLWRSGSKMAAFLIGSILVIYPVPYYVMQYSNRYIVPVCFAIFLPAGFTMCEIWRAAFHWRAERRRISSRLVESEPS
jgi:hypothetical protein